MHQISGEAWNQISVPTSSSLERMRHACHRWKYGSLIYIKKEEAWTDIAELICSRTPLETVQSEAEWIPAGWKETEAGISGSGIKVEGVSSRHTWWEVWSICVYTWAVCWYCGSWRLSGYENKQRITVGEWHRSQGVPIKQNLPIKAKVYNVHISESLMHSLFRCRANSHVCLVRISVNFESQGFITLHYHSAHKPQGKHGGGSRAKV